MSKTRFWIGIVVTLLWLMLPLALAVNELIKPGPSSLKLNEWGDFFAGFLSPLAFLWLVLGYLQQGDELKNSADALRLQAEELKNAVEQQRALVEVTRQQVEAERESIRRDEDIRKKSMQPFFIVGGNGGSVDGHNVYHSLTITNTGCSVSCFSASLHGIGDAIQSVSTARLFSSETSITGVVVSGFDFDDSKTTLEIEYVDSDGDKNCVSYHVKKDRTSLIGLLFTEISSVK